MIMELDILLKLWSVIIVPILTFILGRWLYLIDSKRKADSIIFKKLEESLSHNTFRDFINDTWNMQYSVSRLNQYLDNYLKLIEDPINIFHDKKLNHARSKFDKVLGELFLYVSTEFGFPVDQLDIMNLQSVAPHESERYQRVFAKVRTLNSMVDENYQNYIQVVKIKLLI